MRLASSHSWFSMVRLLVMISAGPGVAHAGSAALVVSGDLGDEGRQVVAEAGDAALRRAGWEVTRPEASPALTRALDECYAAGDEERCRHAAESVPGAERVLAVVVDGGRDLSGRSSATLTAWLVSGSGRLLQVDRRYCERCRAESLRESVSALVSSILRAASGSAGTSLLRVRSTPDGARVLVDGRAVGATPLEYKVFPGRHEVTVDRPGYAMEVRVVDAAPGATLEIAVELRSRAPSDRRRRIRRWLGYGLGGFGVALAATGTWLIIADSPKETGGDMQLEYRDSLWPGVGLTAAGAAAIGVGVWLVLSARGGELDDRQAAIVPAVSGEEAWLFARGHF